MAQEDKLGISNLFDSFYTHFVLRDFVGKVIPGAIVVVAFGYTVLSFRDLVGCELCALAEIPFVVWLFLVGAFWLVGVAVQRFGERCHIVERSWRWQRAKAKRLTKAQSKGADQTQTKGAKKATWLERVCWFICFLSCSCCSKGRRCKMARAMLLARRDHDFLKDVTLGQLRHAERSDVIREGSQNAAVAVVIAMTLFLLTTWADNGSGKNLRWWIVLPTSIAIVALLWDTCCYHRRYHEIFKKVVRKERK